MTYSYVIQPLDGAIRRDVIRRDSDGAFVPDDPGNVDWVAYQVWRAEGHQPDSQSDEPPPRPPEFR